MTAEKNLIHSHSRPETGCGQVAHRSGLMTPLDGVIADMQSAGGRLSKSMTDKPTRQRQQDADDDR